MVAARLGRSKPVFRITRLLAPVVPVVLGASEGVRSVRDWRVVQVSDGTLSQLKDGARSLLVPAPIGDEDLAATRA
jgi:hypothetical protein